MRSPVEKALISSLAAVPLGTAVYLVWPFGRFVDPEGWLWFVLVLAWVPLVWAFWTRVVTTSLRKVIFVGLLLASWTIGGGVVLFLVLTGPFGLGGHRELHEAADCKMPFDVTSCEGIDESFQECRYWVRAKGKPRPERCRRFLSRPPGNAHAGRCDFEKPEEWSPTPCSAVGMPDSMTCFVCTHGELEAGGSHVDAFDQDCTAEQMTATCNMALDTH